MSHEGENNVPFISPIEKRLGEYDFFKLRLKEIAKYLVDILELDILYIGQSTSSSGKDSFESLDNRIRRSALRNGIKDHMDSLGIFALYDKMTQEHGVELIDAFISQQILDTLSKRNVPNIISKVSTSQIAVLRDFTFKEQFR